MARRRGIRRPNAKRAKIHRNYTVEEAAATLGVHVQTVRRWNKQGLPVVEGRGPTLFLGRALREFLEARSAARKNPSGPGEMFCVRCRAPRRPEGGIVDYWPKTPTYGELEGICPSCSGMIYRRVSRARLAECAGSLDISFREAL